MEFEHPLDAIQTRPSALSYVDLKINGDSDFLTAIQDESQGVASHFTPKFDDSVAPGRTGTRLRCIELRAHS